MPASGTGRALGRGGRLRPIPENMWQHAVDRSRQTVLFWTGAAGLVGALQHSVQPVSFCCCRGSE